MRRLALKHPVRWRRVRAGEYVSELGTITQERNGTWTWHPSQASRSYITRGGYRTLGEARHDAANESTVRWIEEDGK